MKDFLLSLRALVWHLVKVLTFSIITAWGIMLVWAVVLEPNGFKPLTLGDAFTIIAAFSWLNKTAQVVFERVD